MKTHLIMLLAIWLVGPAVAQKIITKTLPVAAGQSVRLDLKFGNDIQVRYWDKADISVKITATINSNKLNDALLVETGSTADEVTLKATLDHDRMREGSAADCPDSKTANWGTNSRGEGYYVCSQIDYEIFMPRQAALRLETISGNISIQGATAPVWAKSISGFVDLSWPGTKGANVAMKTITGEVYSDLTIDFKSKRPKHPIVGYLLEGTLLSGGPALRLESISNNVFLRQQK